MKPEYDTGKALDDLPATCYEEPEDLRDLADWFGTDNVLELTLADRAEFLHRLRAWLDPEHPAPKAAARLAESHDAITERLAAR